MPILVAGPGQAGKQEPQSAEEKETAGLREERLKMRKAADVALASGMGKLLLAKASDTSAHAIEKLPERLKLKTFVLKHWKSSFVHSAGHLPSCYHTNKGIHAKYCNGLFIHYKTKEQIMHGEFKQTYVTTIEVVLSMIKELAGLMDKIPAAKVVPAFEESRMFPKEYPKELPKLTQPELCYCTYPMACRKHIKRMPQKDDAEFIPEIHFETVLKLEEMPPEPEYQRIPEYFLPPDLKKIPVFEYSRVVATAAMRRDLLSIAVQEALPDRKLVAGLVSICSIGEGNWRLFGECLNSLAKQCSILVVITSQAEHDHVMDFLENGEGGGVNKPKIGDCRLEKAERKFVGDLERAGDLDVLKSDMNQARDMTATTVGGRKDRRTMYASHCLCVRMDMVAQETKRRGISDVIDAAKAAHEMQQKRGQIEVAEWVKPNQILFFPLRLSSGDFEAPVPEFQAPFDESPFEMPSRPAVRPLMEIPRPSDYLPFPFRPPEDNLPKSIYDLPTGTGSLCRLKPRTWKDPELDEDEKVIVPNFVYTDMKAKRRDTPCLSLVAFLRDVELDLETLKEFKTDERHSVYSTGKYSTLPRYVEPQLLVFEPVQMPALELDNMRWMPRRELHDLDRLVLLEDLGRHPVFVVDGAGSMAGSKWQSLLANMLDLFSEQGRIVCHTSSFDLVITINNNVYSYSGGVGHRRQMTSSSDFSCSSARSWLSQWVPGGNADMLGALTCALDCRGVSDVHVFSDKHPERSATILELISKRCLRDFNNNCGNARTGQRDGEKGSRPEETSPIRNQEGEHVTVEITDEEDRRGPCINCVAVEGSCPARRFLRKIAELTGGKYREFELHLPACPLRECKSTAAGVKSKLTREKYGVGDSVDVLGKERDDKATRFWEKVKGAIMQKGIFSWMSSLEEGSTGVPGLASYRCVVQSIESLLENAGIPSSETSQMFLMEEDCGEAKVDVRDVVRAVVIDGYSKTLMQKQLPPIRFYSLQPKTRDSMIEHSDVLLRYLQEFDDEQGEETLHLLPRDVIRALTTWNSELKLGISETELLKSSFLVLLDEEGRLNGNDLLSFFDKDPSKRATRVQKQTDERKHMSAQTVVECECRKSVMHSDESLVSFLTTAELRERTDFVRKQEAQNLSRKLALESETNDINRRRRLEIDTRNEMILQAAREDHERRLKVYTDNLEEQINKDQQQFFQLHCAAPDRRNSSRIVKNAYDMCTANVSEGMKPGGVAPMTIAQMEQLLADPLSLIDERVKREDREAREKAHAEALQKMGGTRTVPNIVEFNTEALRSAMSGEDGFGRQGLLHDVRECPICRLSAPLRIETEIREQEWHMIDLKLIFPHFSQEMMISDIALVVKKSIAAVFIQGDYFVQPSDVDFFKLTDAKPGVLESYNGMKQKLEVQIQIFVHEGLAPCRKGLERLDTFLKAGELHGQLAKNGFPMKLLKKDKIEFQRPKVSHRPVDLKRVEKAKELFAEHESAWTDYVAALDAEDARQLEADEQALEMHKRLCAAAERENFRRLTKKKERLLREHKQEVRDTNDKNLARLKKYQTLLRKEHDTLVEEEKQKHEEKRAAAEKRFNHDFDVARENNKMACLEEEQLSAYNADYNKMKSQKAMAKRQAYKEWQAADRKINLRNEVALEKARAEYEKIDEVWRKKFEEAEGFTKKAFDDIHRYVEQKHEELRIKAFGIHNHLYGKQASLNQMLIEASEALHSKAVSDVEHANEQLKRKYQKECSKIASENREREKKNMQSLIETTEKNDAEVLRCLQDFNRKTKAYSQLNEQVIQAVNGDLIRKIEETKRDNIYVLDTAREKYLKYYKRDIEHNAQVNKIMEQTAVIREQMVACRRFLNVIKRHFSQEMQRAQIPYTDPESAAEHQCLLVPETVKKTAAKVYSSWWHDSGPSEQMIIFQRLDSRIAIEDKPLERQAHLGSSDLSSLEHANGADAGKVENESQSSAQGAESNLEMVVTAHLRPSDTPSGTPSGAHERERAHRPASARRPEEKPGGVKRWMLPMRRRKPEGRDIYWSMFEQNMLHKPYAPIAGSPLEQKPTITPRKPKAAEEKVVKPKPLHLMSWDERMAEMKRLEKLKEKPVEQPRLPTPEPKDPGNDWTAMYDLFDKEPPSLQPWKNIKIQTTPTRPQTARPFGSSSPRNFMWNIAAGSKLLPGASVTTPQGIEAIELSSHLERMQLEREERERRIKAAEAYRKKREGEHLDSNKSSREREQAPTPAMVDPRKQLVPTAAFVEALLAAFEHMGVEFSTDGKPSSARITEDDSIVPMLPADYEPNRHVPDDGHLCPTDGRRLLVPEVIKDVGVFSNKQHRSNATAFLGGHGRWVKAPPEPSRQEQALWKTQLYP